MDFKCSLLRGNRVQIYVSKYICPMLKSGNGIWGRADGSIILGTYIAPGCLSHPNEPFDLLSERLRKLTTRGSGMTLKIEEI